MSNLNLLEKIYDKLEKLVDEMSEMKVIVAKQEVNLQEHMKRSDLLEEQMKLTQETYNRDKAEIEAELVPVKTHIHTVKSVFKVGSGIAAIIGVLGIIAQIYQILSTSLK